MCFLLCLLTRFDLLKTCGILVVSEISVINVDEAEVKVASP